MRLVQLRAKEIKPVNTKFGERILIVASGDLKGEIKIWRPIDDPAIQNIRANQFFTAAADSQGKYSPIADPETNQDPYVPESPYSPLANMPPVRKMGFTAPVSIAPTPTPTLVSIVPTPTLVSIVPETPKIHPHVQKLAEIMAQCVAAIRNELPGLDAEIEQKYATSLFIHASREIF